MTMKRTRKIDIILVCMLLFCITQVRSTDTTSAPQKTTNAADETGGSPPSVPELSDHNESDRLISDITKREISEQFSFEENLHQLLIKVYRDGKEEEMERPSKGAEAAKIINTVSTSTKRQITPATTVRPVGQTSNRDTKKEEKGDYKEAYLPLYACDEITSPVVLLEDLYRGCTRGCQMREPVKVTKIKVQAPKSYHTKMDVIHYSAVQMYDDCHVDILLNEHRRKSAVSYTLSDNEINNIYQDVKTMLKYNTDLIHGIYPKAECSFWQDNQTSSIITRVRLSRYDLFYAPELDDYYIHIPTEQVNVLQWDTKYDGFSGQYRWNLVMIEDAPCLSRIGEEIVCLGSYQHGDDLHCANAGLLLEPPYTSSWDGLCHTKTVKDIRGAHFVVTGETTMSYKEALKDNNPNIQSLSSAVTHLEELICTTGCSELTLMTMANNTDAIVDTPVGIWKRLSGPGNSATQCSSMDTGMITLLTPACTMKGVVGIKHISSAGMTYHWDMSQLFATTVQHSCLTETTAELHSLMQQQENGTVSFDTFAGRIELNLKTGDSRFLYYNENLKINRKRWFPNVELEQGTVGDYTDELEISVMQQMRNLSAEYKDTCQESSGPIILQNIGGTIWMLEQDVEGVWGKIMRVFWLWKVIIALVCAWLVLYVVITVVGLLTRLMRFKKEPKISIRYTRPSTSGSTKI